MSEIRKEIVENGGIRLLPGGGKLFAFFLAHAERADILFPDVGLYHEFTFTVSNTSIRPFSPDGGIILYTLACGMQGKEAKKGIDYDCCL